MQLVNLTAHTITDTVTGKKIPPSGIIARMTASTKVTDRLAGIPVYSSSCSGIEGLPTPQPNTVYIVSALVMEHVPRSRTDVVRPGNVQKDEHGTVLGCKGFRTHNNMGAF